MKLVASCKEDTELLESLCAVESEKFDEWFEQLNKENKIRTNAFYSGTNLEECTGIKCWFDAFVKGKTPIEALDDDFESAIPCQ